MAAPTHSEIFDAFGAPSLQEMRVTTCYVSRPVRTSDSEGGAFEEIDPDASALLCDPLVMKGEYFLSVDADSEIYVGDLILVPYATFPEVEEEG